MSVKLFTEGTVPMLFPQSKAEDSAALSPEQLSSAWGNKFVPEMASPSFLFTPRRASVADSESFTLKSPPSYIHTTSPDLPLSSRRVLLDEMLSVQTDLDESVAKDDDSFFLVPPQQAFSHTTVSPLVIRPRALRVGNVVEEKEPVDAIPMTAFRSTGESSKDEGTMYQEESQNAFTQVRLKPRPASLKDGQDVWDQLTKSMEVDNEPGSAFME